jgi:hypothetical protein
MAVVTRYFSTAAAGAGDGTTWADRAAFVSGGAVNTIVSAFNFTSDSLLALIGPGTYTLTTAIQTFTGAANPSQNLPCILHGCDSSGVALTPPDPGWVSAAPDWSDATLPVIATTTNIASVNNANVSCVLLKFTASGRIGSVIGSSVRSLNWCIVINSTSNTSAVGITPGVGGVVINSIVKCTGTAYGTVLSSTTVYVHNVRVQGNASASSGSRLGLSSIDNSFMRADGVTVVGCVGGCVSNQGAASGVFVILTRCTLVGLPGTADVIIINGTSSSHNGVIHKCVIVNGAAWGIKNLGSGKPFILDNRFRDNTSGNVTGNGSVPDLGSYTTDSDDATEFVNTAIGDYRIKNTASTWGKGYGAGDEPAPAGGGGGSILHPLAYN